MIASLRRMFRPNRPAAQVEAEIDEELAFHLAHLEQDAIDAGCPPDSARAESLRRFGRISFIKQECIDIQLREQIMVQRTIIIVLIVVCGVLSIVAIGAVRAQHAERQMAMAARQEAVSREMEARALAEQARAAAERAHVPQPTAGETRIAYVTGQVERPGVFNIPSDGFTLRRLLIAAGGVKSGAVTITIQTRKADNTESVLTYQVGEVVEEAKTDAPIKANDTITVK